MMRGAALGFTPVSLLFPFPTPKISILWPPGARFLQLSTGPSALDASAASFYIRAVKILVTGAGGLVGSHFAQRFGVDHDVLAVTRRELDITDQAMVRSRVAAEQPSLIVNCAVIQVDEAEENSAKAAAVNVQGPKLLAEAATQVGAEIIQFSTQYVFDGEPIGRAPYTIEDDPRPINLYGRTKWAGVILCASP